MIDTVFYGALTLQAPGYYVPTTILPSMLQQSQNLMPKGTQKQAKPATCPNTNLYYILLCTIR